MSISASAPSASTAPFRILIIDDKADDVDRVRAALAASDLSGELHNETSLAGALDWLRQYDCDMILLDIVLPDSNGFRTIVAAKGGAPEIPLVVLTEHNDLDFAVAALEAGVQDYLIKSDLTDGVLLRSIRYAVARKSMEGRVRRAERQLRILFSVAPEAVLVSDARGKITLANPAAEMMFARKGRALLDSSLGDLVPALRDAVSHGLMASDRLRGEAEGLRGEERFPAEYTVAPMAVQHGEAYLVVVQDLTERRHAEEELRRLAVTDPLTGLFNRRRFDEAMSFELWRYKRYDVTSSLLLITIDDIDGVISRHGSKVADALIISLGRLLRGTLRVTDIVARLDGACFACLLSVTPLAGAAEISQRLRSLARDNPAETPVGLLPYTISLGVAGLRRNDAGIGDIYSRAHSAVARAQALGGSCIEIEVTPST